MPVPEGQAQKGAEGGKCIKEKEKEEEERISAGIGRERRQVLIKETKNRQRDNGR